MVNTPFANPADAFLIPTLFEGISFNNQTIPYLSLSAHYLTKIKDRPSNEFLNVGEFSANRLGIPTEKTKGTIIGNATYTIGTLSLEGWFYQFADLFNMGLVQANYDFPEIHGLRIYLGAQGVLQKDEGRRLLGVVDTLAYGLKIGAVKGPAELILSYNSVSDRPDAFRNGAILAPYSFSNTTLFTNNIVSSLENSDSGDVYKALLSYRVAPNLTFLVSHAVFKFNNKADVSETDIDWRYGLDRIAKGLSFRNRIGIITSDTKGSDMLDIRVQFEYLF